MLNEVYFPLDLLSTGEQGLPVLNSLMRFKQSIMRCQAFELLNSISASRLGKKYLLQSQDLVKILIQALCEVDPESAAVTKATSQSDQNEHRVLLQTLFRLSGSKQSHAHLTETPDLTRWLLRFLDAVPAPPNQYTKLAIENATGLLQNISLKTQGVEKIVHNPKNPFLIMEQLLTRTSVNADKETDTLNLMAFTYVFSILYQLVSRKMGRNLAVLANFQTYMTTRITALVQQYDQGLAEQVDQAMLIQMESV
jgi:hypothetical protein